MALSCYGAHPPPSKDPGDRICGRASMSEAQPPAPSAPSPAAAPEAAAGWRLDAMAFLTAGITLFIQVLVHRIISAKLANNYAFLVIALTMLGFAFSGVV